MNPNSNSKRRGIQMAIKVTAISVGATALVMAASAPATAETAQDEAAVDAPGPAPLRLDGWSCISRGPLAPPPLADDFEALLSEVPA